ncbi:MAG: hypothetical protein A2014_06960 [Spirochaetes bacterium GWF1_49_6]|nr:MAG: hypothetical protein A2014_06960 [Spirochaetes bacterium GWF1_49_6]
MKKSGNEVIWSEEARKNSGIFIEKIKSGAYKMKKMPNSSSDFPEKKAFESGKALIDNGFIKKAVDRF